MEALKIVLSFAVRFCLRVFVSYEKGTDGGSADYFARQILSRVIFDLLVTSGYDCFFGFDTR